LAPDLEGLQKNTAEADPDQNLINTEPKHKKYCTVVVGHFINEKDEKMEPNSGLICLLNQNDFAEMHTDKKKFWIKKKTFVHGISNTKKR
jgi:hypothetical protein